MRTELFASGDRHRESMRAAYRALSEMEMLFSPRRSTQSQMAHRVNESRRILGVGTSQARHAHIEQQRAERTWPHITKQMPVEQERLNEIQHQPGHIYAQLHLLASYVAIVLTNYY